MTTAASAADGGLLVFKGHGTGNDFVLVPDLDDELELTDALVRALCDRHRGIGADGVLRVVRTELVPSVEHLADGAPFFMDYRNADGSIAEMCGNGVRVFALYLQQAGLVGDSTVVTTRAGMKPVRLESCAKITVEMGQPDLRAGRHGVLAPDGVPRSGRAVYLPNPHVVVPVADELTLRSLDLARPPAVDPELEQGQNVEFVVRVGERHIALRVHERGVGETLSCGTGICAAVVASPGACPDGLSWRVDVPGGTCWVRWSQDGSVSLTGPAVLVARAELSAQWLATVGR
jgi:diaminopimelate epimerase